ncbi:MAG TPA: DUF4184 family protein [Kofleriaceae bacterium]
MPFTPVHFLPGLLLKGAAPRRVSWTAFAASNVVIDLESFYYLVHDKWPVHRQLHTFVGAAIAGIVTIGLCLALRAGFMRIGAARSWLATGGPFMRAELSSGAIAIGAMVGALTHPVLDGLMHQDIEPLQPWTSYNPLRGLVSVGALHWACLIAGLIGALLITMRRLSPRDDEDTSRRAS